MRIGTSQRSVARDHGRRRPNFFIVGAPKCGTTSLADWLRRHPDVCMSWPKEPHYFSPNRKLSFGALSDYERCFGHARAGQLAIGEASTHTIYYPDAVERMLGYQPEARFIVCLRNPIEMAFSYHVHLLRRLRQPVADFALAWDSPAPIFSYYHPTDVPARDYYRSQCALGTHYARLRRAVPEGRLLTVLLEDLVADPARELRRVTDFLGIAPSRKPLPKSNPARVPRSPRLRQSVEFMKQLEQGIGWPALFPIRYLIDRFNLKALPAAAGLSPAMQTILATHFEPEIAKLEALLGRDLTRWRRPADTSGRMPVVEASI